MKVLSHKIRRGYDLKLFIGLYSKQCNARCVLRHPGYLEKYPLGERLFYSFGLDVYQTGLGYLPYVIWSNLKEIYCENIN